jgi:hypothetical protein
MQQRIRYGHGYENPTLPGFKPCTAFDGYETIAQPLGGTDNAGRARRSGFPTGWSSSVKVTYDSHAVRLGRRADDVDGRNVGRCDGQPRHRASLAVMMEHGGGRQLTPLRICQHAEDVEAGLIAMGEPALYFLLYAISETADDARRQGIEEERYRWLLAAHEGRIRKRRAKGGRPACFDIFEPYEMPRGWTAPEPPKARITA